MKYSLSRLGNYYYRAETEKTHPFFLGRCVKVTA